MSDIPSDLSIRANLWIERNGSVVLSQWRAQLLEAIETTGSISGAAERMGIQYRLAWDRLEEMEQGLGIRLLDRQVGGSGGGGARLTADGRELVQRFGRFRERMSALLEEEFRREFA